MLESTVIAMVSVLVWSLVCLRSRVAVLEQERSQLHQLQIAHRDTQGRVSRLEWDAKDSVREISRLGDALDAAIAGTERNRECKGK